MNKLMVFLAALVIMSCGSATSGEQRETDEVKEKGHSSDTLQLNNGAKWKTDSTTRTNVAILMKLAADSSYNLKNQQAFASQVQNRLDSLVQQCKMTGPDHEALHKWLQPVLHDAKELKEEGEYEKSRAQLRKDLQNFNKYFD